MLNKLAVGTFFRKIQNLKLLRLNCTTISMFQKTFPSNIKSISQQKPQQQQVLLVKVKESYITSPSNE